MSVYGCASGVCSPLYYDRSVSLTQPYKVIHQFKLADVWQMSQRCTTDQLVQASGKGACGRCFADTSGVHCSSAFPCSAAAHTHTHM